MLSNPAALQPGPDTVAMVLSRAEEAKVWQQLTEAANTHWTPDQRASLVAALDDYLGDPTPRPAQALWLCCSALYALTSNPRYLRALGTLWGKLPEAERWLAFSHMVWGHALHWARSRSDFQDCLVQTQVVTIIQQIGNALTQADASSGVSPSPSPEGRPRRIAIYAPMLVDPTHAGTAMAFDLCELLVRERVDVQIFSAQEFDIPGRQNFHAGAHADAHAACPQTWKLRSAAPVKVNFINGESHQPVGTRWVEVHRLITAWEPDLVLLVGFMSPLAWPLSRRFPVLAMSLHSLPPIAPADVCLMAPGESPQGPGAPGEAAWPGLPRAFEHPFPYRFWPAAQAAPRRRDALGIPAQAILLITTGHRLPTEINPDWRDAMQAFMLRNPAVHWLLVGVQKPDHALVPQGERIHVLPAQSELYAWLRMADIYLNPPRMGGGASVALAMQAGLAVLALAGSDGGSKLGADAVPDLQSYFTRLSAWVVNPASRATAGRRAKRRFTHSLDLSGTQAQKDLMNACTLAMSRYAARAQFGA